jgi:hypothetical protein
MGILNDIAHIDTVIENLFLLIPMSDNAIRFRMMLACRQWYNIGKDCLDYEAKNARGLKHIMAMGDEERVKKVIMRNPSLMNVSHGFGLIFGAPNIVRLLVMSGIKIDKDFNENEYVGEDYQYPIASYVSGLMMNMGYTDASARVREQYPAIDMDVHAVPIMTLRERRNLCIHMWSFNGHE